MNKILLSKKNIIIPIIIVILLIIFILIIQPTKEENIVLDNNPNGFTLGPGDYKLTLNQNNLERYYLVHTPTNYEGLEQLPVVFVFHGGGSNATTVQNTSKYNELSDQENFLVIYPQGLGKDGLTEGGTWNAGLYSGGYALENNIDDVEFFDVILDDINSKFYINNKKVYSTGISMGGMFSYRLACERSNIISAIAPIASTLTIEGECKPEKEVSVMHFQGTSDKFVPYLGGDSDPSLPEVLVIGGNYRSTEESISIMKENNNCTEEKNQIYGKGEVICESYDKCSNNSVVTLCTITNGGHTWPGSVEKKLLKSVLGNTTKDIDATKESWDFFKKFSR